MGCGDKRKHTCGSKIKAICVYYDGYIPEDSALHGSDCVTVEEAIEDIYEITDEIKDEINLEDLGDACIDYEEEGDKILVREALKKHEELICQLQEGSGSNTSGGFDLSKIDTLCLEDKCGRGFSSLEDLVQAIINRLCDCCGNYYSTNTKGIGLL